MGLAAEVERHGVLVRLHRRDRGHGVLVWCARAASRRSASSSHSTLAAVVLPIVVIDFSTGARSGSGADRAAGSAGSELPCGDAPAGRSSGPRQGALPRR